MNGPHHFEAHAELYDRARPDYPVALWDRLRSLGALEPGLRVVELGAGSGQATKTLLEAGLEVTAVEPGHRLAGELRRRCPSATVLETTAEEADLADDSFDLAVAATSVHWLDLDVVLPKLRAALVGHSRFVVWRNVFGDPTFDSDFRRRVAEIAARRDGPPRPGPGELDSAAWIELMTRSGLFSLETVEQFSWSIELDDRQIAALFTTFSDWSTSEVDAAAAAVRELGGRVVEHYLTPLMVFSAN